MQYKAIFRSFELKLKPFCGWTKLSYVCPKTAIFSLSKDGFSVMEIMVIEKINKDLLIFFARCLKQALLVHQFHFV